MISEELLSVAQLSLFLLLFLPALVYCGLVRGPSDVTILAGDSVVLECETDARSGLAPAWVLMHMHDSLKRPTRQADVYNECDGSKPDTTGNAEVKREGATRYDLIIRNASMVNAGTYFCIDACGMDDMLHADVTVIKGKPVCHTVHEGGKVEDLLDLVDNDTFNVIKILRNKTNYYSKFRCTFEYGGRDHLMGDWIVAEGAKQVVNETTLWTADGTHKVISEIELMECLYKFNWTLQYRIKSKSRNWISDPFLVTEIEPPHDAVFRPISPIYSEQGRFFTNRTIKCEAEGEKVQYWWIDYSRGVIISSDILYISEDGEEHKLQCLAINYYGFTSLKLSFKLEGIIHYDVSNINPDPAPSVNYWFSAAIVLLISNLVTVAALFYCCYRQRRLLERRSQWHEEMPIPQLNAPFLNIPAYDVI